MENTTIVEETETGTEDQKLLRRAVKNFDKCTAATSTQRDDGLDDLRFLNGQQWQQEQFRERAAKKRPALTINRLLAFKNQIVNDGLQNKPNIKYRPVDNLTDPKTADVLNGLARHILNNGDSKAAFDNAYDSAVSCGQGYIRVVTDFMAENSFDQEITIKRIENPFTVYIPWHVCKEADFSDAPYLFIREKITKEEFKQRFPKVKISNWSKQGIGDNSWTDQNDIYIAEYFECEEKEGTVYLVDSGKGDGSTKSVYELPEGVTAIKERPTIIKKWWRYLLTEQEILEPKKEWPCKYHPIIPMLGQEMNIDGEKIFISLTRFAKDPQKMLNYFFTSFTEQVGLQPKAPYIATAKQIEGHEKLWQNMNVDNQPYVLYNAVTLPGGAPLAPPRREAPPQVGSALTEGISLASEFLKETTGIFDASLGAKGNESSGKAIIARQRQGDTANFHFVNNYNRAIRHLGRVLIELIPKIYDAPRTIRIIGEDMTDEVVLINQMHQNPAEPETPVLYDLTVGNYDVIADVGPSYDTKRTETADSLMQFMQAIPQAGMVLSDLFARSQDWTGSDEAADRLKAWLGVQFPGIIQDKPKNGSVISETDLRAIIADMQKLQQKSQMDDMQKQQMTQMIQQQEQLLKDKTGEQQVKMDTAVIRANAEIQKAGMQLQHQAHGKVIDTALKLHEMGQQPEPAPAPNAENTPA
jgi:hypothetical protein